MPSLWASWVAWPMRLRESIPVSNSSSVRRTSRANACGMPDQSRHYLAQPRACCAAHRDEHLIGHGCFRSSTMEPENLRGDTFSNVSPPVRMHVRVRHRARFYSLTGAVSFGRENVRNGPARKAPSGESDLCAKWKQRVLRNRTEAVRQSDWSLHPSCRNCARLDAGASVSLASGRTQPVESRDGIRTFRRWPGTVVPTRRPSRTVYRNVS